MKASTISSIVNCHVYVLRQWYSYLIPWYSDACVLYPSLCLALPLYNNNNNSTSHGIHHHTAIQISLSNTVHQSADMNHGYDDDGELS